MGESTGAMRHQSLFYVLDLYCKSKLFLYPERCGKTKSFRKSFEFSEIYMILPGGCRPEERVGLLTDSWLR